jgi:hypothetical protein
MLMPGARQVPLVDIFLLAEVVTRPLALVAPVRVTAR